MSLKRKMFNQCFLPAMTYGCQTWSLTKALVKKLETSQWAMKRKMLNVKLKDKIRNTIIRQRSRVTGIVQQVTNTKWKWAGHVTRMKDNRWTIRSTEWQIKGVRSVGRPKHHWRDDIVEQQGAASGVALTQKNCVFYAKKEQATQIWKCRGFTVRKKQWPHTSKCV